MEKVKLIALDMDGTLFNNQGEISQKDRETLKKATESGNTDKRLQRTKDYWESYIHYYALPDGLILNVPNVAE